MRTPVWSRATASDSTGWGRCCWCATLPRPRSPASWTSSPTVSCNTWPMRSPTPPSAGRTKKPSRPPCHPASPDRPQRRRRARDHGAARARPVPADRQGPSTRGAFLCVPPRLRPAAVRRVCRGEDPSSPRRTGRMDRPGPRGADGAAMPGRQARMSGSPPRRRSSGQPFVLDGRPGTPLADHSPRSVEGRAFGACCSAGKLRSPLAHRATRRTWSSSGRAPLRWTLRGTLRTALAYPSPAGRRITAGSAPEGASRPQKPRPTGPPRGSGAAGCLLEIIRLG